jgi:hypothetical protein
MHTLATRNSTAQSISRSLTAAGFRRTEFHSTRVRGWHTWNAGFELSNETSFENGSEQPTGRVELRVNSSSSLINPEGARTRREAMMDRVIQHLIDRGFTVVAEYYRSDLVHGRISCPRYYVYR